MGVAMIVYSYTFRVERYLFNALLPQDTAVVQIKLTVVVMARRCS